MDKIFFENIHKVIGNYPYLDLIMEDINYIAHFHEDKRAATGRPNKY